MSTIKVETKVKQKLDELKNYPSETYNQILSRMLEIMAESKEELSSQTLNNIQKSLEDIKAGRVSSHEEVKRRLNLK